MGGRHHLLDFVLALKRGRNLYALLNMAQIVGYWDKRMEDTVGNRRSHPTAWLSKGMIERWQSNTDMSPTQDVEYVCFWIPGFIRINYCIWLAIVSHQIRSHLDGHFRAIRMHISVTEPPATRTIFISRSVRERILSELGEPRNAVLQTHQ